MFRFGDEVYFVGVASCVRSAEEARVRAFEAGIKKLGAYAQGRDTSRLFIETACATPVMVATPTCLRMSDGKICSGCHPGISPSPSPRWPGHHRAACRRICGTGSRCDTERIWILRAIKDGIAGSTMTGTRHLTDREISDLIAYLNSLR